VRGADDLLHRLAAEPQRAALLLDVDGVLAPIVAVPSEAAVPPETRAELARLRRRYALVACISGRAGDDARRIVGLDGLVVVGEHGLELDPEAPSWRGRLEAFVADVDWDDVERKPLTATFHYRRHPDESEALAVLEPVAERARAAGLVPRFGRKVLELRPPLAAHKGTAVAHLLDRNGLERALYAGDDSTDVDAFRALAGLELGIAVAVASREAPRELHEAADLVVGSPAELLELLRSI
jgi:trehalose 6-phosphate phosphatase